MISALIMSPRLVFQDCRIEPLKALFDWMKHNFYVG